MPEPLFTYDYHEQFLDSVSKYRMLLNLFKCSLFYGQYIFCPWIFIWNFSWNVRTVAWSYFQVSLCWRKFPACLLDYFCCGGSRGGEGPALIFRQAGWESKKKHPHPPPPTPLAQSLDSPLFLENWYEERIASFM